MPPDPPRGGEGRPSPWSRSDHNFWGLRIPRPPVTQILDPPLNHAQSLLALRPSCFVIVVLSGVNAQQGPTQETSTPLNREFSSISSCCFFFFFADLPFTVERYGCLSVPSFKVLMKKKTSNTIHFRGRHSNHVANACLKKATPRADSNSYSSGSRTCRRSTLSEFFHQDCRVYEVFIDRLFFSAFFLWVRWNRNDTRAWSETKPKPWLRNSNTYWSPTACQSLTIVQDSSALSMLTKTYKFSCRSVICTTHLVAGYASDGQSEKRRKLRSNRFTRPHNFQDGRQFFQALSFSRRSSRSKW